MIQKGAAWVGSTVGGALKRVMPRSQKKGRKSSGRTAGIVDAKAAKSRLSWRGSSKASGSSW